MLLYKCPMDKFEIYLVGQESLGDKGVLQVVWYRGEGRSIYPILLTLEKDYCDIRLLDILKETTHFICEVHDSDLRHVLAMRVMLREFADQIVNVWVEPADKARLMPVLFGGC